MISTQVPPSGAFPCLGTPPGHDIPDARQTIETKRSSFADELLKNVDVLGKEIEKFEAESRITKDAVNSLSLKGRVEDLHAFIDIFQQDLDALRDLLKKQIVDVSLSAAAHQQAVDSQKKVNNLPITLMSAATRLNAVAVETLHVTFPWSHADEDPHVDLVGKADVPTSLPAEQGHVIERGLQMLQEARFSVQRIRADGHCLSRAVLVQILDIPFLKMLLAKIKADPQLSKDMQLPPLEAVIAELESGKKTKGQILASRDESLLWISFLRRLPVNWWKHSDRTNDQKIGLALSIRHDGSPFKVSDKDTDAQILDKYFDQMPSVTKALYGGQPEIEAYGAIFGRPVIPLDVGEIGSGQQKIPTHFEKGSIVVSRRSNHFDVLIPPPEVY